MYDLCSEFLVMSDLVGATTTTKKSNFKSSISLIILYIWIKSSLNLLQFKENKSSFQKFSPVIETMGTKTEEEKHIYDLICWQNPWYSSELYHLFRIISSLVIESTETAGYSIFKHDADFGELLSPYNFLETATLVHSLYEVYWIKGNVLLQSQPKANFQTLSETVVWLISRWLSS